MSDKFGYTQLVATAVSFGIASLGGVAAMLHSGKPATLRTILAAFLYSGVLGLVVFLLLYHRVSEDPDNIFLLLGVSGFAGIGGVNVVDLVLIVLKGKLNISIGPKGAGASDE